MAIYTNFDANAGAQRILVKNSAVAVDQACCCGCTTDSDCPSDPDPCRICINGSCTLFTASPSGASTIVEGGTATGSFSTNLPSGTSVTIGVTAASNFYAPTAATRTVSASGSVSFSVTSINNTIVEGDRYFRFYLIYTKPNGETCTKYSGYWLIQDNDGRACCCNGSCSLQSSATACQNSCPQGNAVYYSTITSCSSIGTRCELGRCCFTNGNCLHCSQDACTNAGGAFWTRNRNCSPYLAPACHAPCCRRDGSCTVGSADACPSSVGVFYSVGFFGLTCDYVSCYAPCCYEGGACNLVIKSQCPGTWYPDFIGGSCYDVTCTTCNSSTSSSSSVSGRTGPPGSCLAGTINNPDPAYLYPNPPTTIQIPAGCNCVRIVGGADDILVIDGIARPNTNGAVLDTCQGQGIGTNVDYYFAKTGSFTIAAADTKGGTVGYNVTVYFSSTPNCGAANFTASPQAFSARRVGPAAATSVTAILRRFGLLSSPVFSAPTTSATTTGGVGTELKALLARFGILSTPTCSCNARAEEMDRRGVQWCRDNEELIISWLEEEAEKRDLFFMPLFAKLLLWRAIRNAEKKGYG